MDYKLEGKNKMKNNLKESVQAKYLNTIDRMDYDDRAKLAKKRLLDNEELHNSNGKTYAIVAVHEDNALLYDPANEYHPFVVARGVYPSLRSWTSGSYHGTYEIAKEVFNERKK